MNRFRPQDPPRERYRPLYAEIVDALAWFMVLLIFVVAALYLAGQLPTL